MVKFLVKLEERHFRDVLTSLIHRYFIPVLSFLPVFFFICSIFPEGSLLFCSFFEVFQLLFRCLVSGCRCSFQPIHSLLKILKSAFIIHVRISQKTHRLHIILSFSTSRSKAPSNSSMSPSSTSPIVSGCPSS